MVDRRQFFSGLLKAQIPRSEEERKARRSALESYVLEELVPSDLDLAPGEQAELSSRVRSFLDRTEDGELFSTRIAGRLQLLVEDVLEPWHMSGPATSNRKKPQELWIAAIESVPLFLNSISREQMAFLLKRFAVVNRLDIEVRLRENTAEWIQEMETSELLQYDTLTIREPVFARLSEYLEPEGEDRETPR